MIWRRRLIALAAVVLVVVGVLAFTGGEDDSEKAGKAATAIYHAFADADPEQFCAQLSEPVREEVAELRTGGYIPLDQKHTCEAKFMRFRGAMDPERAKKAEVADVAIDGDRATVAVVFDEDQRLEGALEAPERVRLAMVKEGGDWKLATFTIPEPPSAPGNVAGDDEGEGS